MKKHIIWTNFINIEDYEDYLAEEYPEVTDENEKWEIVHNLNDTYLYDARDNLNVPVKIIGIADLGLWNGRKTGYKLYDNLNEILYSTCDINTWYVEKQTLKSKHIHHDGRNYVNYYVFRDDLNGADKFLDDLYYGNKISKSRFYKYCKSAVKLVKNIYAF